MPSDHSTRPASTLNTARSTSSRWGRKVLAGGAGVMVGVTVPSNRVGEGRASPPGRRPGGAGVRRRMQSRFVTGDDEAVRIGREAGSRGCRSVDGRENPVLVTLIIACEVGFWALLAGGLALRYLAKMPRLGAAVLLCEPL